MFQLSLESERRFNSIQVFDKVFDKTDVTTRTITANSKPVLNKCKYISQLISQNELIIGRMRILWNVNGCCRLEVLTESTSGIDELL